MSTIPAVTSGIAQKARSVLPLVFRHRAVNPLELAITEIGPATLLGLAYLYQRGHNRDREGAIHTDNKWLAALMEGGTSSVLVQNTRNLYPLIGLGWAAYEMGTAESNTSKVKQALKAAVLFPMGFLGVHLGMWINDGLRLRDAAAVADKMKDLKHLTAPAGAGASQLQQELQPLLANVQGASQRLIQSFRSPSWMHVKDINRVFKESMRAFSEKMAQAAPAEVNALGASTRVALQGLTKAVGSSQFYEMLRVFNPTFGYLLGITFLGLPLVKVISDYMLPQNKETAVFTKSNLGQHIVAPLWFDRVTGMRTQGDILEDHLHPYNRADGPQMLNDYWSSGGDW